MTNPNAASANDTVRLKSLSELESDAMDVHSLLEGLQILIDESGSDGIGRQAANGAYITLRIALEKSEALMNDVGLAAVNESRAERAAEKSH